MKPFLRKYIPMAGELPIGNTLRELFVPIVGEKHEKALNDAIKDRELIVFLDETPDRRNESVVDLCIRVVGFDGRMGPTYVLDTFSMNVVNSATISQELIDRLSYFGVRLSLFIALCIDSAGYMKKAFVERLNLVCPKLVGTLYLAHILNLAGEAISSSKHFSGVDNFLSA
eukprot:GCRY01006301.1.p1 GENE.GCRY01006301.1~~GCRY01006301.1.p1  ORF type:complete len:171 (+),score=7.93 GCRY01006301.1:399-911(+)